MTKPIKLSPAELELREAATKRPQPEPLPSPPDSNRSEAKAEQGNSQPIVNTEPLSNFVDDLEANVPGTNEEVAQDRKDQRDASSCINCHFSAFNGLALVCRRSPPRIIVLPEAEVDRWRKGGQAVPNGMAALFPIVGYETWCGEHSPGDPAILPLPEGAASPTAQGEALQDE